MNTHSYAQRASADRGYTDYPSRSLTADSEETLSIDNPV